MIHLPQLMFLITWPCLRRTGVEVSLENLLSGIKFSWPIYKSGFKVIISSLVQSGGTWAFASAFHWSVWVAMGGTVVYVAFMVNLAEVITHRRQANRRGKLRPLHLR
jgi:hypothetical protein